MDITIYVIVGSLPIAYFFANAATAFKFVPPSERRLKHFLLPPWHWN